MGNRGWTQMDGFPDGSRPASAARQERLFPLWIEEIENQSGKYADNFCGTGMLCGPYKVTKPEDNINGEERYMTICNFNGVADIGQPIKAECPEAKDEFGFDGYYPWLDNI